MIHYKQLPKRLSKSFKYWEIQELATHFKLTKRETIAPLEGWLTAVYPLAETVEKRLEQLSGLALQKVDYWNEEELKMRFVAPLMELVDFEGNAYTTFYDRPISAEVDGHTLNGVVDMVVASGYQKPIKPFFFLHEYKPQKKLETDPQGQLLAAMLAAQAQNQPEDLPLYGCYIIARHWYFVALSERDFAISGAFDCTRENELKDILYKLKYVKDQIDAYFATQTP